MAFPAAAQEAQNLVQIRLLPERAKIQAGEEIWVGIEQSIAPGWHTYWKNPGDSGTAPRVTWHMPGGFEAGEILWPVPHKIKIGALANYGYEDRVILLQKLKTPEKWDAGLVTLTVDIEILVCKEECIPEYGTYSLTLNGPESEEDNAAYFQNALARLPQPLPEEGKADFQESGGDFVLRVEIDSLPETLRGAEFYPEEWGVIVNSAPSSVKTENGVFYLSQKRDQRSLAGMDTVKGILAFGEGDRRAAYAVAAERNSSVLSNPLAVAAREGQGRGLQSPLHSESVARIIIFALMGGLILNLMPCVFPVLSLKALSLLKTAEKNPGRARAHGVAYALGVISSFVALALLLIALRAGGSEIGWGFQLQNPVVVTLLAYLLFVIGLNLAGVFEFSASLGNIGAGLTKGESLKSSFFTGVLATVVATPCTAPFMGVAVGAALLQPPVISLGIFAALGFGLALPYLALSFAPALQRKLPKPGAWMEIFRQLLAFPMFASAAWLVWVLSQQAGPMGVLGALMGLVLIAFALWLMSHAPASRYWRYKVRILAIISLLCAFALLPASQMDKSQRVAATPAFGEAWSPEVLEEALKGNDPVFVEMTAAWCITCKVNHAAAIDRDATRRLFAEKNVRYLIGDWTNQDSNITEYLNLFGRSGVPIYVYYGPPDPASNRRPEPFVLPQVLTTGIVAAAVQ